MEWVHLYLLVSHSLSSSISFLLASSLGVTPFVAVLIALSDMSFQSLLLSSLVVVPVLTILYHFSK